MMKMDIMDELLKVFRDVFDDEEMVIFPEMTAADYEDWDSLAQIQLIVAVERKFNIKFSTDEVLSLKNVGEFASLTESKTGGR
jgi:acyl carrier protein